MGTSLCQEALAMGDSKEGMLLGEPLTAHSGISGKGSRLLPSGVR